MIFLFLIGAVVGTFFDSLFTRAGIATYATPFLFQEAWWVPFLFGFATLLIGSMQSRFHPMKTTAKQNFFISLCFLILACLSTAYLKIPNIEKGVLLFVFYLFSWGVRDRTLLSFVFALITAVCGSFLESALGKIGLYTYAGPDFMGIPTWLPFLYLHVSQAVGYLGRVLLIK